jgi:hypothetical protein
MILVLNIFFLLIELCLFQLCHSVDANLQVDLVFPKNNTIYQSAYVFPIVFALHSPFSAWQYKPYSQWRLLEGKGSSEKSLFKWRCWLGPLPSDKFLAISCTIKTSYCPNHKLDSRIASRSWEARLLCRSFLRNW